MPAKTEPKVVTHVNFAAMLPAGTDIPALFTKVVELLPEGAKLTNFSTSTYETFEGAPGIF